MKGYTGKILQIDLSVNKISTAPATSYNENFNGGRGVGASI